MQAIGHDAPLDAGAWARKLRPYRRADPLRASLELAITSSAFVLAWLASHWAWQQGHYGLYALLLLPAAGFLVRLFMIQHDCGHGSFFPSRRANDWTGRVIGVATLTAYDHWRASHAHHHANSGNLDRRGIGDVRTLTVAEYAVRPKWGRLRYRLYRHPVVLFGFGPLYLFLLQNRLPFGFARHGWKPWVSTMGTNAAIGAVFTAIVLAVGSSAFVAVHVPIVLLAAAVGVWLFYVQHQFERTHWAEGASWSAQDAALHGSSHYDLPAVMRWFTANIGVHHVHHLSSRVPCYRLPEVLRDYVELRGIGRVTLLESLRGVRLVLWDERRRRLVSFAELESP